MTSMSELQQWFKDHYGAECDLRRREEMRIPGPKDGTGLNRFGVSMGYASNQIRVRAMIDRNWVGWLDCPVTGRLVDGGRREAELRILFKDCLGIDGAGWVNPVLGQATQRAVEAAGAAHVACLRWMGTSDGPASGGIGPLVRGSGATA